MKAFTSLSALGFSLIVGSSAPAANLALGAGYSYDGSAQMPVFSGGGFYRDENNNAGASHAGYGLISSFDSGELNDGVIPTSGTSTAIDGSLVAWDPVDVNPIPATITFDLGSLADITEVTLNSYAYVPFAMGAPDDFSLSFSSDNVTYSVPLNVLTGFGYSDGNKVATQLVTETARYVRLEFDGDTIGGDKYGLTEISIEGTIIPEPSSGFLFGTGLLLAGLRRRR